MSKVTLVHLAVLKYDHDGGPGSLQVSYTAAGTWCMRSTHSTDLSFTFFSSPKKTFSISCLEISPREPVCPEVADLYYRHHISQSQFQKLLRGLIKSCYMWSNSIKKDTHNRELTNKSGKSDVLGTILPSLVLRQDRQHGNVSRCNVIGSDNAEGKRDSRRQHRQQRPCIHRHPRLRKERKPSIIVEPDGMSAKGTHLGL